MATIWLRKLYDTFCPADEMSAEAMEGFKANGLYKAEITQPRNIGFHRKFFALLNLVYKNYEQPEVFYKGIRVFKSFERFRDDVTISCGHYELELNKLNNVVQRAKSISFAKMDQTEFEALFSTAITVILAEYLTTYSESDMDFLVSKVLQYS
jgi:hypothetical protein